MAPESSQEHGTTSTTQTGACPGFLPRRPLLLLLLACFLTQRPCVGNVEGLGSPEVVHVRPDGVHDAPGFSRARTDEDMQPLYRDNLEQDLAYWHEAVRQQGRPFSLADLVAQANASRASDFITLLVIKDGASYLFKNSGRPNLSWARLRVVRMQRDLEHLHGNGSLVPNTIMLINTQDKPLCAQLGGCTAPVFTFFKRWPAAYGPSPLGQFAGLPDQDREVLLPSFSQTWGGLTFFPWEHKTPSALLRAAFQGTMHTNSTRYQLSIMSAQDQGHPKLLDVGITKNRKRNFTVPEAQMKPFVNMSDHARWRFLINTDGHTASSRLGHLLGINSVVLKERSPWVEYYYRSLVRGRHMLEFDLGNVLALLQGLQAPERSTELQIMATSGQQFSYRYLHPHAKAMYARQAVIQYNKLFPGIEEAVGELSWNTRGRSFAYIVEVLNRFTEGAPILSPTPESGAASTSHMSSVGWQPQAHG